MRKVLALAIVCLMISAIIPINSATGEANIKITEVYYHTKPGCEYIKLENWGASVTLKNYSISDGEGKLILPDLELKERDGLTIAEDRGQYEGMWRTEPDIVWDEGSVKQIGDFDLSYGNDSVTLRKDDQVVDAFYYGEGIGAGPGWKGKRVDNVWEGSYAKRKKTDRNCSRDWNWTREWKVGQSSFDSKEFTYHGQASVYVSPDSSYGTMMHFLGSVEDELTICVYEIKNGYIAKKLANLSEKGVEVRMLVEGSPVSGMVDQEKVCLDMIRDAGADVRTIGKDTYSPYDFVHCKYMIADGSSLLISSENFGYTGYSPKPSNGNRGWGVILKDEKISEYYQDVFDHDWRFGETLPDTTISEDPPIIEQGGYKYRFEQKTIEGELKVTPVLSPDSSMSNDTVLDMISSASEYIKVEQFYAYDWPYNRTNPYIKELISAARRGVEVQIILDSTWYNIRGKDNNDEMVNRLNNLSSQLSIPIEAKLIEEGHGLTKVHNKGMIVDGEKALVSSINWNSNSVLQNREAGVIIENKKVARYFEKVFDSDWRDDTITPIADAGRDEEVVVGEVHNFDASNSWDDENITKYLWDLDGDGRYESEGEKISKIYQNEGIVNIKLYTEDKEGNRDVDTATITVKEKSGFEFVEQEHDGSGYHLAIYILSAVIVVAVSIFLYKTRSSKD